MKTNKLNISALLLAVLCITLASCDLFKADDNSYDGPPTVEFTPTTLTQPLAPGDAGAINITAQLVGPQRSSDVTFNVVTIDSATTAVEGSDYALPSTSITISANSSSANFTINVSGANLAVDEVRTLALRIQGTDDVVSGEIIGRFDLTLVGDTP